MNCGEEHPIMVPDFFTDEAANAMVLEKARFSVVPDRNGWTAGHQWMNGTVTMWASGIIIHPDRKTAIALACLALIEKEQA